MNKHFKYYVAAWAILLIFFHLISFGVIGGSRPGGYTGLFWGGYVAILLAFIGQLICAAIALKAENRRKLFYHIPLITLSFTGLVLSFIAGGLCMAFSSMPYWVGIIVCPGILVFTAVSVLKAKVAADIVSEMDEQITMQTLFIKQLTGDVETLLAASHEEPFQTSTKKIYEAVRYSDPVSHEALSGIESQITIKFSAYSDAVKAENKDSAAALSEEILILVKDRNQKCKLLK